MVTTGAVRLDQDPARSLPVFCQIGTILSGAGLCQPQRVPETAESQFRRQGLRLLNFHVRKDGVIVLVLKHPVLKAVTVPVPTAMGLDGDDAGGGILYGILVIFRENQAGMGDISGILVLSHKRLHSGGIVTFFCRIHSGRLRDSSFCRIPPGSPNGASFCRIPSGV